MKVVIPGGTGQVGGILRRALAARGHEVVVLSRHPAQLEPGVRHRGWDGRHLGDWAAEVDGADAVVNLAGRTVSCRYTAENLKQMMDSRVESTRVVGQAIAQAVRPPKVWLQMSTATIYADRRDAPNDEDSGVIGGHEPGVPDYWEYSVRIARCWEAAQMEAVVPDTRRVALRSAMVMSPDRGGVFDVLLRMARLGLGGPVAGGGQYVSWIHDQDFVAATVLLLERDDLAGPVNLAAPGPLPQHELMRVLRQTWGRRFGLPATAWMAEIGAWALRSDTELLAEYADPLRYPDGAHAAVKRLSHQLRNLTIHPASVRSSERFRNPSGVARKIQNLMFFDTDGAAGSENGSAVDRRVAAGSRQLDDVSRLAAEVRRGRRLTDIDVGPEARSEDAAPVSPSDYASAIDLLESFQGDLENEVLQKRRVEQRFLRQKLFGTRSHGTCSLCGRELPVDLLVAAHIKARADCSRDEKLDVGNIVMAACHLGCDVLYERGYLAVDKRGIVVTASMDPSEPVAEELSRREGRLCASFTDGTASYFAAHYERVFRGARGS